MVDCITPQNIALRRIQCYLLVKKLRMLCTCMTIIIFGCFLVIFMYNEIRTGTPKQVDVEGSFWINDVRARYKIDAQINICDNAGIIWTDLKMSVISVLHPSQFDAGVPQGESTVIAFDPPFCLKLSNDVGVSVLDGTAGEWQHSKVKSKDSFISWAPGGNSVYFSNKSNTYSQIPTPSFVNQQDILPSTPMRIGRNWEIGNIFNYILHYFIYYLVSMLVVLIIIYGLTSRMIMLRKYRHLICPRCCYLLLDNDMNGCSECGWNRDRATI